MKTISVIFAVLLNSLSFGSAKGESYFKLVNAPSEALPQGVFIFMESQEEIWKDVVGYEGLYQVSNLGNVMGMERVLPYKRWNQNGTKVWAKKQLKPQLDKDGYLKVQISKNGTVSYIGIHRLVAKAFIPNPENKPEVNHLYGIKSDNRASQLEWVTGKEQMAHAFDVLKIQKPSGVNHYASKTVYQYDFDGNFIREYTPLLDVKNYGFNTSCVYACCNKRVNSHSGFIFSYNKLELSHFSNKLRDVKGRILSNEKYQKQC